MSVEILELTKALRNEDYSITAENAFGLSLLSEELAVPSLQEEVTRFITDHTDTLLIPRIQRALASSEDTFLLEQTLQAKLMDFVNNSNILSLPLNLLSRVVLIRSIVVMNNFLIFLSSCSDFLIILDHLPPSYFVVLI
jgi:hypothetical protein